MLNSNDWQDTYGQFLIESQALLHKSEECLSHLELIGEDEDAIACLLATLDKLTAQAEQASVDCIADFSRQLGQLLRAHGTGSTDALPTLKRCLTLISWQLELIDPRTGELPLDSDEQQELLDKFAGVCRASTATADCAPK
jgi:hypothetical protein